MLGRRIEQGVLHLCRGHDLRVFFRRAEDIGQVHHADGRRDVFKRARIHQPRVNDTALDLLEILRLVAQDAIVEQAELDPAFGALVNGIGKFCQQLPGGAVVGHVGCQTIGIRNGGAGYHRKQNGTGCRPAGERGHAISS